MDLNKYNESALGLFGLKNIMKLAHIPFITADDVYGVTAFEGFSGTGKTTLVSRLGMLNKMAGGGDYGVYSADKVKYEDFIGLPIPPHVDKITADTRIQHIPLTNSISTKETLLIDEANRASYDSQEKFLQLFSTRKIDGQTMACKYIYVAMNPVLSDDPNENYEGVQPLDKAYGERVQALITMPTFHDMTKAEQVRIMTSCFNQVRWEPAAETVELHKEYLRLARELYTQFKDTYIEPVSNYLHAFAETLHSESQKSLSLQARRMQFILVNTLAVHSLNCVLNPETKLATSVAEALLISFPHRLWEHQIQQTQIQAAHETNVSILNDACSRSAKLSSKSESSDVLMLKLQEDVTNSKTSMEERSKRINQMIPDVAINPLDHYMFAFGIVKTLEELGEINSQKIMKANELERLQRIIEELRNSKVYKSCEKRAKKLNKNPRQTDSIDIPEWIDEDLEESAAYIYRTSATIEKIWALEAAVANAKDSGKFNEMAFSFMDKLKYIDAISDAVSEMVIKLDNQNA